MVVQTADEAMQHVNAATHCDPGYCLKYTRTWLEIGSKEADAADAWRNAIGKHPDDKHPPRGAPIFWTGGSSGHGHICLARGNDMRSTDIPNSGKVGNNDGSFPRKQWGLTYVGWAEGFNGVRIPYLGDDWRASGEVYVNKLKKGQHDSQSVSRLRWRLQHHKDIPEGRKPGLGDSSKDGANYTADVVDASKWWMQNVGHDSHGNGENWTNKQAKQLFGDNYTVVEE
jgi:hypothetical protein